MENRIKQIRKELNLTQQEFADRVGVKRGGIANYEIGRNELSDAVISLICREFNINEIWLRTGNGEMFIELTCDEQIAAFIGSIHSTVDDTFKKRFVYMLSLLDESEWMLLEQIVNKI